MVYLRQPVCALQCGWLALVHKHSRAHMHAMHVSACAPSQGAAHFPGLLVLEDSIKHPQPLGRQALDINVLEGDTLPHEHVETVRGGHLVESEERIGLERGTVPEVRPMCM